MVPLPGSHCLFKIIPVSRSYRISQLLLGGPEPLTPLDSAKVSIGSERAPSSSVVGCNQRPLAFLGVFLKPLLIHWSGGAGWRSLAIACRPS